MEARRNETRTGVVSPNKQSGQAAPGTVDWQGLQSQDCSSSPLSPPQPGSLERPLYVATFWAPNSSGQACEADNLLSTVAVLWQILARTLPPCLIIPHHACVTLSQTGSSQGGTDGLYPFCTEGLRTPFETDIGSLHLHQVWPSWVLPSACGVVSNPRAAGSPQKLHCGAVALP